MLCRYSSTSLTIRDELTPRRSRSGFSQIELLFALCIMLIVAAISYPSLKGAQRAARINADVHGIAGRLMLAKMRASATFTWAKVEFDETDGTYTSLVLVDKDAKKFQAERGGRACLNDKECAEPLAPSDAFGFGSIATPPPGLSTIEQSPEIIFNSRGLPVDATGSPVSTSAVYVKSDMNMYYAMTVTLSGHIMIWRWNESANPPAWEETQ